MPKGKKKDKKIRGPPGIDPSPIEEDKFDCDNASVLSTLSSDSAAGYIVDAPQDAEVDETSAQEELEEKLKDVIDQLTEKSAQGRLDSLKSLQAVLSKKYMEDFVFDRKITINDALEKCVKRGKGEEVYLAAHCFVLVLLQLGAGGDSEELFRSMRPYLQTVMADTSAGLKGRRGCAEALGIGAFIAAAEIEDVVDTMTVLEKIFKASYLKGDGHAPSHSPEVAALHTSALLAWSLLLTIAPPSAVSNYVKTHVPKLPQLLESGHVELRIAAGEVIALLYELAREEDEDYEGPQMTALCDTLRTLATDSNKYRAKKERCKQRHSFRDIVRTVEEWECPSTTVKFGAESVVLDGWTRRRQYDALCHVLGTGMNTHLSVNELVRDVFELGSVRPEAAVSHSSKGSKAQRQYYNAAAFRARTKARSKLRDKRSDVMSADS